MNTTNSFPVRVLVENGSHMVMMREKVARAYFNCFQPSGHFQKKLDPFSNLLREHSKLLKNVETTVCIADLVLTVGCGFPKIVLKVGNC